MSKRKASEISSYGFDESFGFDAGKFLVSVKNPTNIGSKSHHLQNHIKYFEHGLPIFQHPHDILTIEKTDGMFATIQQERIQIASLHTSHTVSLYAMAHYIHTMLQTMSTVVLHDHPSTAFKTIDMRGSTQQQGHVILNAKHQGRAVVLKTATDVPTQLKYIIEAVIHHTISSQCPDYFPTFHFIGFTSTRQLVLCSEQLPTMSVASFMRQLTTTEADVWRLVYAVCHSLLRIQQKVDFTHRDCHISNIFYGHGQVKFIDFDWSCVQQGCRKISVPQYLYDTTRPQYCCNKSVDCCIFLRTLGPALKKMPLFRDKIYTPLMMRYEEETKHFLKQNSSTDTAALQLYKMSTSNQSVSGEYSHEHGLKHHPKIFDYRMAYYEWSSMTPTAIIEFMKLKKL